MTDTISLNFFVWGLLFLSAKLSAIKFGAVLFWVPCRVYLSLPFDTLFLCAELVDSFSPQSETPLPSLLQKKCVTDFSSWMSSVLFSLSLWGTGFNASFFPKGLFVNLGCVCVFVCLCAHMPVYQDARGGTVKV